MKKSYLLLVIIGSLSQLGCRQHQKPSQPGVYKLERLTVSVGGKDSVYARQQLKFYTDDHFAYASLAPDSSVGFGVGAYRLDTGNHIIETNIYSSRALDSSQVFHLEVRRKDSTYTQVIPLDGPKGIKYRLTEVYRQLPSGPSSQIDGVWKLDKAYLVKGKDTSWQHEVQFKAYLAGHFMFVHRYALDNTNKKFKNGFGYGDFTLKNDTISEDEQLTSHPALMGRSFSVKITFMGPDQYQQIISDVKTGERSFEVYRRLK